MRVNFPSISRAATSLLFSLSPLTLLLSLSLNAIAISCVTNRRCPSSIASFYSLLLFLLPPILCSFLHYSLSLRLPLALHVPFLAVIFYFSPKSGFTRAFLLFSCLPFVILSLLAFAFACMLTKMHISVQHAFTFILHPLTCLQTCHFTS